MIEKFLLLLREQQKMLPTDDRLSKVLSASDACFHSDELTEDDLEMVQAAAKLPEWLQKPQQDQEKH